MTTEAIANPSASHKYLLKGLLPMIIFLPIYKPILNALLRTKRCALAGLMVAIFKAKQYVSKDIGLV
ncbi:hypothetical protein [Alteromonas gracilis]|uniref:hypothetical protein n=1 Tax=Alteromonas gracilis TaxID=1479524 RepID=UPI003736298F